MIGRSRRRRPAAPANVTATAVRHEILDDAKAQDVYELTDAIVRGRLELSHVRSTRPIIFDHCTFVEPPVLNHARLGFLAFRRCSAPGLNAQRLRVDGELDLTGSRISGPVDLTGAAIVNDLSLEDSVLGDALGHDALDCEGASVGGRIRATRLDATGRVSLISVEAGPVELLDVGLRNDDYVLHLDRLRVRGSLYLDRARVAGGIHAIGARVGGSVYFSAAHLGGPDGQSPADAPDALLLDRSVIEGDIHFTDGFRSTGRLSLDDIAAGQMKLDGASIRPGPAADGAALTAARAHFRGPVSFAGKLSVRGTVRITAAEINGEFEFRHPSEDAVRDRLLDLSGTHLGQGVRIDTAGRLDLAQCRVDGRAYIGLEALRSADEESVAADFMALRTPYLAIKGCPAVGYLDLTGAKLGVLQDEPERWRSGTIVLNGLEYADIHRSGVSVAARVAWLKAGTSRLRGRPISTRPRSYVPQPYEQLAGVYRRTGNDREARLVLLSKWRARNAVVPRKQVHRKLWNYVQDVLVGYGHVPSRAFAILAVLVFVGASVLWSHHTVPRKDASFIETLVYALSLAVPGYGFRAGAWQESNVGDQAVSLLLSVSGLTLGAAVVASIARSMRRD